ncbi:hypothetical protein, partial [Sphingomonas sp.]|uniref:hypothetical protein n=1 Tax=Sphingomonas sp. TaxID=28214 RepID=UPI0031D19F70
SLAISRWRIWASSSFLRHCDEAQILLNSQPQICASGADGGHNAVLAEHGRDGFASAFLRDAGLDWAADLMADAPQPEPGGASL